MNNIKEINVLMLKNKLDQNDMNNHNFFENRNNIKRRYFKNITLFANH